ncbi:MAG TPA: hypothetical protein PKX40_19705 [Spirochaetota bacterium]|jgi:hypothetical protein|nr:hypothetical protein [Spirochaetota bacterium]
MGNENEIIKKDAVQGRSLFLPEEIHDQDGFSRVYVLEEEYARTRKNKNYKLYLFILLFVAVVIGGVLLFKLYRDWRDRIINVDITEFEDLRLKEIIDSARKRGSNIDVLKIEMEMLEVDMLGEILKVRKDVCAREAALLSQGLSDDEIDRRVSALKTEEEARIKKVRASYQAQIRRKKSEIWALEEAREKEEKELASKGAETRITNADRLYNLQMKRLKDKQDTGVEALKRYYDSYMEFITLKYNPMLDAQPVSGIISAKPGASLVRGGFLKEYDPLLGEGGFTADDFGALRKRIGDEVIVLKRLMRVPYKNSVPPALKAIDGLSGSIVRDYETLWSGLARTLQGRNQLLKKYDYLFDFVLSAKKENGLVLDPRDADAILVRMNRSLKIDDGQSASVYNGDKYVGRVKLYRDQQGNFRAKVVSLANRKAVIQPTNRVMLDVKK